MNGAFFQFLGRFQVTIQKYGFSHVSETDVVEMKIRFGIFYHYWITLRESQTISLVHFVIGLKTFSRTVPTIDIMKTNMGPLKIPIKMLQEMQKIFLIFSKIVGF